ncbi:quinone oxidoreductase-like protein 2 [Tanacetum coccineum]
MEALICRNHGDPTIPPDSTNTSALTITTSHPIPKLKSPSSVLVKIKATSVVVSVGQNVTKFKVCDGVCGYAGVGSFAQYIVRQETKLHKVADGSDLVVAAAIPLGYGTSHQALVHRANLKSGQVLLVLGAAGGVGLSAVQIGKIIGATVIAVARGPEKVKFLQSMGADHVVDLSKEGLIESVRAFLKTKNLKGVNVLYDPVGGKLTKESMKLLAWGAQILVIGFASGDVPLIPANIALVKNWTIHGFYLGGSEAVKPGVTEESTNELLSWLARGLFKVNISHSYKLQEVNRAFLDIKDRKAIGKVMIIFDDPKSISYLLGENVGVNVGNLVQVRDLVILRNGFGELRDSLETKYMVKDAYSKKFLVSNFFNYKAVDSRHVMEQYNELLRILAHEIDKPKSNNVAGTSVVNIVEHNNSIRYNDNKGKRKHRDNTKADPNKKSKLTCWKCGKIGHLKRDCKGVKIDNKTNGSGTCGLGIGSNNPLKDQVTVPDKNESDDIGDSKVPEKVFEEVVVQQPDSKEQKG